MVIIIEFVLHEYASKMPSSRGYEDDIKLDDDAKDNNKKSAELETKDELLQARGQSHFGDLIKFSAWKDGAPKTVSPSEIAQMAYAGENTILVEVKTV